MTGSIPPPNPLTYEGQVVVPFISRTFNPQTTFNQFPVPTIWINTATSNAFILVSKALGIAIWVPIGGSPGELDTITTPDAVVVVPTAGNINFLNGTGMNITGAGSNITFNITGSFANLYTADSGTATPSANNLNIFGANAITTSASGNTITISNGGTVPTIFHTDSGDAIPSSNAITVHGGIGIATSGSGSTITVTNLKPYPSFYGFEICLNPSVSNVTGDGTDYTVPYNSVVFDTTTGFDTSTGIFTATVAGYYLFLAQVTVSNLSNTHTSAVLTLTANGSNNYTYTVNPFAMVSAGGQTSLIVRALYQVSIGDQIFVHLKVSGGTKTVQADGSSTLVSYITAVKVG